MDTIITNSKNSETSDRHRLILNLSDKINFKRSDKFVALSNYQHIIYMEKCKNSYKHDKFKISASTWNDEFEICKGSYTVSDIFKIILNKP